MNYGSFSVVFLFANSCRTTVLLVWDKVGQGNRCSVMWAQAFQEDGELSLKKFPELAQLRQAVRPCYSDWNYFVSMESESWPVWCSWIIHGFMVICGGLTVMSYDLRLFLVVEQRCSMADLQGVGGGLLSHHGRGSFERKVPGALHLGGATGDFQIIQTKKH